MNFDLMIEYSLYYLSYDDLKSGYDKGILRKKRARQLTFMLSVFFVLLVSVTTKY